MCREKTPWEKSVEFHGHICVGLAMGYRASLAALRALGTKPAEDEELVAIVENDACGVDALQVLTGCTFGKGNLIFRDYGKHVYTVGHRDQGAAVRVAVKDLSWALGDGHQELRQRVFSGAASEEEMSRFRAAQEEAVQRILEAPEEQVCEVQHVAIDLPPRARIFPSVFCQECGERVMKTRTRKKGGKVTCIPCSQ